MAIPEDHLDKDSSVSETSHAPEHGDGQPSAISRRRRALIKGSAAAVPVIMTLRSGSAVAMSSSHCLENNATETPEPVKNLADADNWLRRRFWISSNDKVIIYETDSGYLCVDADSGLSTQCPSNLDSIVNNNEPQLALIYVDGNLNELGRAPFERPQGAGPIAYSCWTSIA